MLECVDKNRTIAHFFPFPSHNLSPWGIFPYLIFLLRLFTIYLLTFSSNPPPYNSLIPKQQPDFSWCEICSAQAFLFKSFDISSLTQLFFSLISIYLTHLILRKGFNWVSNVLRLSLCPFLANLVSATWRVINQPY